ncbi:MAG: serine hydrolase domain-containing protein [Bacteroidota bacterium]
MKTNKNTIVLCAAIMICSFVKMHGQIQKITDEVAAKIETVATTFLERTKVPGLSMSVSKKGEVIYAQGFGFADVEKGTKVTPETRLRTASVAKLITATALGKLMDEGKVNLDEPIKTYVPYIDKKYAMLTSRQLAAHTSGLAHRPKGNGFKKKQYEGIEETVVLMKSDLLFEPDTDYSYSTHAFNFLAAVIEGASGSTYLEYLKNDLFQPLGMKNTYAENINELTKQDAKLYLIDDSEVKPERVTNGSYKIPGASFRSTPTDLVKMTNAYRNGFLSAKVVNEMFKGHQLANGKKINVGVTWRRSFDSFGNDVVEHAGNWLGARTVVVYYPKEELTISIMLNASCSIFIEETAHILAQFFLNEESKPFDSFKVEKSNINVTFSRKKTETSIGSISLEGGKGFIQTNSDGFLKYNPLLHIKNNNYALVTKYGLMHIVINQHSEIFSGKGYIYGTMNEKDPKLGSAQIVF